VVASAELWKMGQLRPGDRVRLVPLGAEQATALEVAQNALIERREADAQAPLTA